MKMLIADDNNQIVSILEKYAKKENFTVETATAGDLALDKALGGEFDIILLDIMMPGKDGLTVCREIRKKSMVPIIMITARGEDFDKIMGLDTGADDYMVKPFSPGEVMARVRAVLRRMESKSANVLKQGNLTINLDSYTAYVEGEEIILTKKEMEILYTLAKYVNKVFSRDQLLNSIWGYDYYGDSRTVDSHIKRLRSKLERSRADCQIKTIWGVGYKLEQK